VVDEESQSARIYKRLAETAVLHRAGEEALLMDPALQVALDWREKNRPNAVWARRYHPEFETAMSFLDQSLAARDAETQERQNESRGKRLTSAPDGSSWCWDSHLFCRSRPLRFHTAN
jgi:hypothetical protein